MQDERIAFLLDHEPSEVARITEAIQDWADRDVGPYYEQRKARSATANVAAATPRVPAH